MFRSITYALVLTVVLGQTVAYARSASEPVQAFTQAELLAKSGAFAGAAAHLVPYADRYPQDYSLQLQTAWYFFQAKNYPLALDYYNRAHALTTSPGLAYLGLAWTHLRMGELVQARLEFEGYLTANPHNPDNAAEGLALIQKIESEKAWKFATTASFLLGYYDQNAREDALGGALALNVQRSDLAAAVSYSYGQYGQLVDGMGMGRRQSSTISTREHLAYASLGYGRRHGGMSIHGAFGTLGNLGTSFAGGLTSRLTWFVGDNPNNLRMGLAYGSVLERRVLQGRLTHDFNLWGPLWVSPGVLVQLPAGRDVLTTGTLALALRGEFLTFVGTGRYGRTHHEVDWTIPLLVTHQEDLLYGGSLGVFVKPSSFWAIGLNGAWEHYENQNQVDFEQSDGFFGILSLTLFSGGDSQ